MKLLSRRKSAQPDLSQLVLRAADGTPLTIFPSDLVTNYRRMTTALAYQREMPRKLGLLAALSGEGVTYTALALGLMLATDTAAGVCVVELNWWAPGMVKQLGSATMPRKRGRRGEPVAGGGTPMLASPGCSAVVTGHATLDEALIRTDLPNLVLLPAGDLPLEQRPMIARSEQIRAFVDDLSARFDYLLLDLPAITASSDAIALASLADAGCLVVRQGVTSVTVIKRSLDEIKHVAMLGIVLNQAKVSTPSLIYNLFGQE